MLKLCVKWTARSCGWEKKHRRRSVWDFFLRRRFILKSRGWWVFFSKLDAERSSSPWLCVWHYVEKLEWSASACPGCFAKSVFPSCDRAAAWKRCCASIQCLKSQQLSPFTQSLRLKAPKLAVLHRCESLLVVCYWLVSVWVGSAWCCSGLQQLFVAN